MLKLIFGAIIVLFCLGVAFFVGFALGSTMTPLNDASAAGAVVLPHTLGGLSHV